jgi:putative ABC transport system ATP-binding protein
VSGAPHGASMIETPIVALREVTKTYQTGDDTVYALINVDLEIAPGEFMSLVGPSGSGKSTLLNLIGGIDAPTAGQVFVDGQRVDGQSEAALLELRRRKVAYVFQEPRLIPSLTARENVMLPGAFTGDGGRSAIGRAAELLARVGLEKRADHMPHQLSGGEAQRVAVARALWNRPKLVLADEPTGNLDHKTRLEIMGLLESLNAEGQTIIVVTHDAELAGRAPRQIALHDGKIERDARALRSSIIAH